ncbi:hypothetical protein CRH01_38320 [Chryseobacterium rhizosphaerae]|jgi:hypothetical protein|nr:hypothetical protein CRH01_38320 [Chryseobacterium rhizosphaerae]
MKVTSYHLLTSSKYKLFPLYICVSNERGEIAMISQMQTDDLAIAYDLKKININI